MMILLVEDDFLIAMTPEAELTDAGHTVRGPASSASRALQLAALAVPDLALVDINLRDGHGQGIGLARELRQRWGVPSPFLSGQSSEAHANRDAALGLISKPYRPETALKAIGLAEALWTGRPPPAALPHGLELFV